MYPTIPLEQHLKTKLSNKEYVKRIIDEIVEFRSGKEVLVTDVMKYNYIGCPKCHRILNVQEGEQVRCSSFKCKRELCRGRLLSGWKLLVSNGRNEFALDMKSADGYYDNYSKWIGKVANVSGRVNYMTETEHGIVPLIDVANIELVNPTFVDNKPIISKVEKKDVDERQTKYAPNKRKEQGRQLEKPLYEEIDKQLKPYKIDTIYNGETGKGLDIYVKSIGIECKFLTCRSEKFYRYLWWWIDHVLSRKPNFVKRPSVVIKGISVNIKMHFGMTIKSFLELVGFTVYNDPSDALDFHFKKFIKDVTREVVSLIQNTNGRLRRLLYYLTYPFLRLEGVILNKMLKANDKRGLFEDVKWPTGINEDRISHQSFSSSIVQERQMVSHITPITRLLLKGSD